MTRTMLSVLLSIAVLTALALPVAGQLTARRITFADVAAAVLHDNLTLRAAALDVAVAEAQLAQARGGRLPQVTVSGSYTRVQERAGQTISFANPFGPVPPTISFTLPPPDSNIYSSRLGLQFPLYTGGRIESQIALAEANLRGAQASFERTKQLLLFRAEQLYLQALLGQETVAAAQRALDQASENQRVANARLGAGAAPQFDVLQAEVAVATAEQSLIRARTSMSSAQASLNAAINERQDMPLVFVDTLEPRAVPGTLAEAIARALRDRPERSELRSRIAAVEASIELAASGGRPTINLGAGYDVNNSNGMSSGATGSWSVSLTVTMSLYDGGITQERVHEAQLRVQQLRILDAQTQQQIELDVRLAWLGLEQATGELAATAKAVEQGREAARLAGVRYQAGVGTSLEVLSAQSALAQAELALASARFNQNQARIQWLLATGTV